MHLWSFWRWPWPTNSCKLLRNILHVALALHLVYSDISQSRTRVLTKVHKEFQSCMLTATWMPRVKKEDILLTSLFPSVSPSLSLSLTVCPGYQSVGLYACLFSLPHWLETYLETFASMTISFCDLSEQQYKFKSPWTCVKWDLWLSRRHVVCGHQLV